MHRGTVPKTRKRFPTNYEWNNYILNCSQKKGLHFPSHNLLHTAAYFARSPDSLGIRGGNSTKRVPCALLLIIQWLIRKGSGTLTHSWLGGNCCDLSAFLGGSQTWHIHTGVLWQTLLTLRTFSWPTPISHLFTHTCSSCLDGLGYLSEVMAASVLHPLPIFILGAAECPKSLTRVVRLYQQLIVLDSWEPSWKPDVLARKCLHLCSCVCSNWRSRRSDHVSAWAPRVWMVHRSR